MENLVYREVKKFKKKYPLTIAWRLKAHSEVITKHLNEGEYVLYAFAAQKNDTPFDFITSCATAVTNKRLLIGTKRLLFGYFFTSITPDLFNDLKVQSGLFYGRIYIDTLGEFVKLSKIPIQALSEIETQITENIMREKKKYAQIISDEIRDWWKARLIYTSLAFFLKNIPILEKIKIIIYNL